MGFFSRYSSRSSFIFLHNSFVSVFFLVFLFFFVQDMMLSSQVEGHLRCSNTPVFPFPAVGFEPLARVTLLVPCPTKKIKRLKARVGLFWRTTAHAFTRTSYKQIIPLRIHVSKNLNQRCSRKPSKTARNRRAGHHSRE